MFIGMDVHKDSTVFDLFDPEAERARQHRSVTVASTREGIESVLRDQTPFGPARLTRPAA